MDIEKIDYEKIDSLFNDDVKQCWENCLPHWKEFGRVQDLPHGVRKPRHTSNFAKVLGRCFAEHFCKEYSFIVEKLESEDEVIQLIAFDLLEMIAWELDHIPNDLAEVSFSIPAQAYEEIKSDWIFEDYKENKVGSFLVFLLKNG